MAGVMLCFCWFWGVLVYICFYIIHSYKNEPHHAKSAVSVTSDNMHTMRIFDPKLHCPFICQNDSSIPWSGRVTSPTTTLFIQSLATNGGLLVWMPPFSASARLLLWTIGNRTSGQCSFRWDNCTDRISEETLYCMKWLNSIFCWRLHNHICVLLCIIYTYTCMYTYL